MSAGSSAHDCPYQGLQPFSLQDAEYFAGRDNDVQIIISALYASKLTVFYGESGVGKTSVISAGVLPELTKPEHRVAALLFRDWQLPTFPIDLRTAILRSLLATMNSLRGDRERISFDALETAFREAMRDSEDAEPLSRNELYNTIPLDRFMTECCAAFSGRLFFIFDQFEEYFYYHSAGSSGAEFDGALARAVNSPDVPANFLVSLREDSLGKLDRLRGRIPHLFGNMLRLEHLDRKGIEDAIRKPIPVYNQKTGRNAEVKDDLVKELITQVREDRIGFTEEDRLPFWYVKANHESLRYKGLFLQVVLTRLWKAASVDDNEIRLTLEQFVESARGKEHDESEAMFIVRTYFNDMMSKLSPLQRDNASEVLRFLVRPSGQKKSRSAAQLAKDAGLKGDATSLAGLTEMLDLLASDKEEFKLLTRIETGSPQERNSGDSVRHLEPEYEIRHDVMGVALRDWCDRQRQAVQLRRQQKEFDAAEKLRCAQLRAQQLELDAAKNLAVEQEKLRQQELQAAEKLRQQELQAAETLREEQLKRQALEFAEQERLREAKQKRKVIYISTLAVVVLIISLIVFLVMQTKQMKLEKEIESKLIATTKVHGLDRDLGVLLGTGAAPDATLLAAIDCVALSFREGLYPLPDAVSGLRFATSKVCSLLWPAEDLGSQFVPALVSPDGKFTATVDAHNRLVLWDNWTFTPVTMAPIKEGIIMVGVSPESKRMVVLSPKSDVWVWNLPPKESSVPSKSSKSPWEELGIPNDEALGRYSKGSESPWKDYHQICSDWFLDAIGVITRTYNDTERMDLPNIKAQSRDKLFTDGANAVRDRLMKNDVEGARNLLAQLLSDFHIDKGEPNAILANMYVTSAKLAFKASSFAHAADDYERAQALNAKLDLANKIKSLEKLEEGNVSFKNKHFPEAAEAYQAAARLDSSLLSVAPGLLNSAAQLEQESEKNNIAEMQTLLDQANNEAKAGHAEAAITLYREAKIKAPDALKDLVPETEYSKFAPKGPGQENANPPVNTPQNATPPMNPPPASARGG